MKCLFDDIMSFWKFFRFIFVIFLLYLLGDAFYRWDGFKYYASFSEFLPNVALVTVLWSIAALLTALPVWLAARALEYVSRYTKLKVRTAHMLLLILTFLSMAISSWVVKKQWHNVETSLALKLLVLSAVTMTAIFIAWILHGKIERWADAVHERITPLVWIFGIWFLISVPLVFYHVLIKGQDKASSQGVAEPSAGSSKRPDIILLTFDALAAEDMSVYGYYRETTPFMSEWAKGASLFTNTEAASNWTPSTTVSLMTGKRVWTHLGFHEKGTKLSKHVIENLLYILKKYGYFNTALINSDIGLVEDIGVFDSIDITPRTFPDTLQGKVQGVLNSFFGNRFKLYDWIVAGDFIAGKLLLTAASNDTETTRTYDDVFNRFLSVVDNKIPGPFFAWIHFYPPHFPFLPPAPYAGMFDASDKLRTYGEQNELKYKLRPLKFLPDTFQHFPADIEPEIAVLRARYDEFIRYCDERFRMFIAELNVRNKLENTVIVVSSDHGESFKHNYLTHGGQHLYEQVTRIPLIIKEPGQKHGRVINDLVEQVDIPSTVLQLADIPVPSWMEGRSLVPLMRGESLAARPAFSMNLQPNSSRGQPITKGTIAVWEGDFKMIHYLEDGHSMLFNLKNDFDELDNILNREPEVSRRLLDLINRNLRQANERIINESISKDQLERK